MESNERGSYETYSANNPQHNSNESYSGSKYYQHNSYESHSESKYHSARERGGLIPVTANIIKNAEVTQDETVEFQGVSIIDITAVGYVVDYKEVDNKISITLYDYTGLLNVNFFIRQDNDDSILDNFKYEGNREPVQIFGTVKVYKGEKSILGAKLIKSNCNYVLYHRANVIHSFLYLTGKLKEKSGNNYYTQNELFRKFGKKAKDIINKLVSENKLIDNDDFYEIIS